MRMDRRFWTVAVVFTALQVAMVVAGHYSPAIAQWFAIGGMGLSLLAGIALAWRSGDSLAGAALGGALVGAECAFVGIAVSLLLGDVEPMLLAFGTLGSAVAGAIGGALARLLSGRTAAA
jgi:hypothetical protein